MDLHDKAIRDFRRHLAMLLTLRYALPLATGWSFAWGAAVLALRATLGMERTPLLWGLIGLVVCAVLAVVLAQRHMPAVSAVRALLDEQSGCGGLLMAGAERDLGDWRQKMPTLQLPRVQWDGRRSAALLAIAAGFVLLAFLAPSGLAGLTSNAPLEIDREIGHLLKQIALLKQVSILTPERANMLMEKLAELRDNSSGKIPSRTLEALDHLRDLAGAAAREATEDHTQRRERLGEAEAMAEMLRRGAELLGPHLKREMMAELAGLLDKNGLDGKQLAKQLDAEQLKKLAEMLRDHKIDLARQIEKLHKAGLIDAELLAKCRCAGDCDGEALRAFLGECNGKVSLEDIKSLCKKGGKGGITHGPGAGPLTWSKPGSEDGYKFKEEVLPPGALASLKSSPIDVPSARRGQIVHHKQGGESAASGALRGAAADGGSANTDILLPRHRAAVQRYFDRPASSKK